MYLVNVCMEQAIRILHENISNPNIYVMYFPCIVDTFLRGSVFSPLAVLKKIACSTTES